MSEKPILFNTEMVKAILEGRKTQTRRILKNDKIQARPETTAITIDAPYRTFLWHPMYCYKPETVRAPYQYGDVLWVRETWAKDVGRYMYKANYSDTEKFYMNGQEIKMAWRPSIHMPRAAARLFLRVTSVRIQRLQEITSGEAVAEGIKSNLRNPSEAADALIAFEELWNSTVKPADLPYYGWGANPWVWVIGFVRCDRP